ncbi:receptor-type tyrosine-protein phosphatase eta [Engraulis encrasicolus]|uniref:receptor-type tyrosine-protein phosphatase eta n=1 Tax=Engraulis encrasicolus TaxID=184585 RepID=UPI002FD761E6
MRRSHLCVSVFMKAILLTVIVKISPSQTCTDCNYKAHHINITEIQINVSEQNNCTVLNHTHSQTGSIVVVSDLIPGTTYSLLINCSTACCSNYTTLPGFPTNVSCPAQPGNSSLTVSWDPPVGSVSHYVVYCGDRNETSNVTDAEFQGLSAGTVYSCSVAAVHDSKSTTSDSVQCATKPNPPTNVYVSGRTSESLTFTWSPPASMSGAADLSYQVSSSALTNPVTVNGTSYTLPGLNSGTEYSISVLTVGPQGLQSTASTSSGYTSPNSVRNLRSSTLSTSEVNLQWDSPLGHQSYYTYQVQAVLLPQSSQNVSGNTANITQLQPGTEYNCSVTTTIPQASLQALPVYVLAYTNPNIVSDLTAEAISTSEIRLTWSYPTDHKNTYTYEAQLVGGQTNTVNVNSTTFQSLTAGTNYTFRVTTIANSRRSQCSETSSFTKVGEATGLSAIGTTSTMTVNWAAPSGAVSGYEIAIYENLVLIHNVSQTTTQQVVFGNLSPSKIYKVKVVTLSGPYRAETEVQNATYPNPPVGLEVDQYTSSSISLRWSSPVNMSGVNTFIVTHGSTENTISVNTYSASSLVSGTQYTFNVRTRGALNYESTEVTASQYTNPNPATALKQTSSLSTDSVTLEWTQSDSKSGYLYQVTVSYSNGTQAKQENVSQTTATVGDLQSAIVYNVNVITLSAGGTQAAAVSTTALTKPYPVTGLIAITLNDTAVFLNWTRPEQFPPDGSYYITTNCSSNETTTSQTIYITGLSPGITCFSTVYSLANSVAGDAVNITYSTKPPKVSPEVTHVGTNGINVTWTPVSGVDTYIVTLATGNLTTATVNISNASIHHNLSKHFPDLLPATMYTVIITTVRGDFEESSDPVSIATYPTMPGQITVLDTTTDSVSLEWGSAPNMTNANFSYVVTWNTTGAQGNYPTTDITHVLSGLNAGTIYNVFVATQGPMGLRSEAVSITTTTKPGSVTSLTVSTTSTSSISVQWTRPSDFKDGYSFRVSGGSGRANTTQKNEYTFSSLRSGTNYSFSVQALTADGTAGALVNVSGCTVASVVSQFRCEGPNRTEAMLLLTWDNPPGSNLGFQIQIDGSKHEIQRCNPCSYNISRLSYDTQYTVAIATKACGSSSTLTSITCKTGITDPPTPTTVEGTVTTSNIEYNKFTLQLSPSLFNNSGGPVVNYGILLSSDTGSDNEKATQYISKTYSDWTAGQTPTYLAVVKSVESTSTSRSADGYTVTIGDGTQWNNYENGELSAKGSYSYAVVIFTNMELNNGLISTSQSYFSVTQFIINPVNLPENPAVIGGAIGGAFAAVVIILIIAMIFVVGLRRKKSTDATPGVPIHSIRNKVSEPIKVEDYEAHYRRQRADSFCGFAEEFEDLKSVGIAQPKNSALAPENRTKNRYNNVLPYDNSRVKLSILGNPFDDYINASNMPGYNSRKEFIAAQGPLPGTVNDFWRMIWEKNVHTVVMLTRCNEQGRVKCEEYWPAATKHFDNLIVTTTSDIPLEDWTIRDFDLKNVKTAETRAVRQFHFTAWPDHGVPETTELLINFRHLVREHMDQYSRHSPTMVHCSAGVGRTGTFIAIDRLIFQIERDAVVDIYGIIHDLRMHRTLMVQTEDQYVFLNQCAIDIIRSRTGTNVDLIYQNTAALTIYENFEVKK